MIENQLDSSMSGVMLGFSKKWDLKEAGCLVHCIARLLNKPRLEVHERLKKFKCFFADSTGDVCLLDLTRVPLAYPELRYIGKQPFDQEVALGAIKKAGGLIVEVDYNPIMDGTQQHFVYYKGGGKMEDPLGGVERSTTYYKKVVSIRIFEFVDKPPQEDNMTEEQKNILKFLEGKTEGDVREAFGYLADRAKNNEQMATLSQKVLDLDSVTKKLEEKIQILGSEVSASNKIIEDWQNQANSAKEQASKATEQINAITEDRNNYRRLYEKLLGKTIEKLTVGELLVELINKIKNSLKK